MLTVYGKDNFTGLSAWFNEIPIIGGILTYFGVTTESEPTYYSNQLSKIRAQEKIYTTTANDWAQAIELFYYGIEKNKGSLTATETQHKTTLITELALKETTDLAYSGLELKDIVVTAPNSGGENIPADPSLPPDIDPNKAIKDFIDKNKGLIIGGSALVGLLLITNVLQTIRSFKKG